MDDHFTRVTGCAFGKSLTVSSPAETRRFSGLPATVEKRRPLTESVVLLRARRHAREPGVIDSGIRSAGTRAAIHAVWSEAVVTARVIHERNVGDGRRKVIPSGVKPRLAADVDTSFEDAVREIGGNRPVADRRAAAFDPVRVVLDNVVGELEARHLLAAGSAVNIEDRGSKALDGVVVEHHITRAVAD